MGAAAEFLADVVGVGADIEALGAVDGEVDIGQCDAADLVSGDAHRAWLTFDDFAFAREFVEWYAVFFDGGDHRRHLFELAGEGIEGGVDLGSGKCGHFMGFEHFALTVLGASDAAKRHGAFVFLVLAHQQVLDLGGAADDQHEQAGGHWIEGAAMADFFRVERPAGDGHDIVRGHIGRLVDEQHAAGAVLFEGIGFHERGISNRIFELDFGS